MTGAGKQPLKTQSTSQLFIIEQKMLHEHVFSTKMHLPYDELLQLTMPLEGSTVIVYAQVTTDIPQVAYTQSQMWETISIYQYVW